MNLASGTVAPERLLADLTPSATLAIHERVAALRQKGDDVFHLGFGESRFPVHPKLREALAANAHRSGYLPVLGLPALRTAVAEFWQREFGRACDGDQVVIGPGSKLLLYAALMALDGELLLPAPSWVSYAPQARMIAKPVCWLPTSAADDYLLQPQTLTGVLRHSRRAGRRPGLLLLNSPNNPTGTTYPAALLQELAEVARREGLVVLSDEIYALVTHDGTTPQTIADFYPEGTVVFSGISKDLSLGGWRLGVMQAPPGVLGRRLLRAVQAVASETWSAVAAPIQYAALTAFADDPDIRAYRRSCGRAHGVLISYLWEEVVGMGLLCPRPTGAFYVFPSFAPCRAGLRRRGIAGSEPLAERLLSDAGIAALPGSAFGMRGDEPCLRLSTGCVFRADHEAAAFLAQLADPLTDPREAVKQTGLPSAVERMRWFVQWLLDQRSDGPLRQR